MGKTLAAAGLALAVLAVLAVTAGCGGPPGPHPATAKPAPSPVTRLHYAPNGNVSPAGRYLPGAAGFNLAEVDADARAELDGLPAGVRGLVWLGDCGGVTAAFRSAVGAFAGDPRLFGFYVMDEPLPPACPAANLAAEDAWIHAHVPGARTFAILENRGTYARPSFAGTYTPADSGLDLVGIDPYPVRSELASPGYAEIGQYVRMAEAQGWPRASIVPVYQAFGGGRYTDAGGGHWVLPTPAQERQILARWAAAVPDPPFDYAYSWGSQNGDVALSQSPALQSVFAAKNAQARAGT
jgi:hypothetical protein